MAPLRRNISTSQTPAVHLGLNFAVGMALCSYIGYKIDVGRGEGRAFTLAGMFLGLIYGAYEVWKVIRLSNEADTTASEPDEVPDSVADQAPSDKTQIRPPS